MSDWIHNLPVPWLSVLDAISVAVVVVLIVSHDSPFTGQISVRPDMLLQVMPQAR